jgi:DnaJ-domain-containing protein 1
MTEQSGAAPQPAGGADEERIDLTSPAPRADYSAWRERMRAKSDRNRGMFQEPEVEPQASYWDPELLFQGPPGVTSERAEHLSILDLRDGATLEEIASAYRNLAKLHHPDRWVSADAETQRFHEECMRSINEAYHALRDDHRV